MNYSSPSRGQLPVKSFSPAFEKAVVLEVNIKDNIISPGLVSVPVAGERMPRNSILVRRIGDVAGTPNAVCFPFFSSHIQMPVKPGETVWVYFDSPIKSIGYWFSRVHGDAYAEDPNFSHHDRSVIDPLEEEQTIGLAEKTGKSEMPDYEDFPNNSLLQTSTPGDDEGAVEELSSVVDEYEKIINQSFSYGNSVLEAVPRFNKRVGDLVLQGSNNSAIILGTSRGWKKTDTEFTESNSLRPPSPDSGTIDIVAGRSRNVSISEGRTKHETYINSRLYEEVLKDPLRRDLEQNIVEGDPDFFTDASRIYVSMSSVADVEFSLDEILPSSAITDGERLVSYSASAAIVAKSDEVRIIARKDDAAEINGNIKIIKEGDPADDAASILLLSDGTIQMSASKFIIGRSPTDGGADDGPEEEDNIGKLQPYVKYKQLEDLLKAVMTDIRSFCDTLTTHTTPGYGAPSPQINQAATTLKSAMDSRESEIVNLKSKRIFGE